MVSMGVTSKLEDPLEVHMVQLVVLLEDPMVIINKEVTKDQTNKEVIKDHNNKEIIKDQINKEVIKMEEPMVNMVVTSKQEDLLEVHMVL